MIPIIKSSIPTQRSTDTELWKEGLLYCIPGEDEPKVSTDTIYLFHETEIVNSPVFGDNGEDTDETVEETIIRAMDVVVPHPFRRKDIINACEMRVYGLKDAMDVASFTAGLARKSRENANDPEVIEHDEFIEDVKAELDKFGILS